MPGSTNKQPADLLRMFKEARRNCSLWPVKAPILRWSNSLPEDQAAGCHIHGVTPCDYTGGKNCRGDAIHLRPWLRRFPALAYCCLVHEMVHYSYRVTGDKRLLKHGKIFNDEMKRIARMGGFTNYW